MNSVIMFLTPTFGVGLYQKPMTLKMKLFDMCRLKFETDLWNQKENITHNQTIYGYGL